ncbi:MAG: hypothetical protein AB7P34_15635 [Vicinamibacterales bacterium]
MPYLIGIVLSLSVGVLARRLAFDRDRAFYPTALIVIACYYVLFAAISASMAAVVTESIVAAGFAAVAVWGFRTNLRIVAMALVGHGFFDALHGELITNAGVPYWWPAFCLAYDVGAGCCLAWLSRSATYPAAMRAAIGNHRGVAGR